MSVDHPDHLHDHNHARSTLSQMELRVRALESVLRQKDYFEPAALDLLIETYESATSVSNFPPTQSSVCRRLTVRARLSIRAAWHGGMERRAACVGRDTGLHDRHRLAATAGDCGVTDRAPDMGGAHGFGRVEPEAHEPVFHAEWERRAFALTLASGRVGKWNLDMSRFARDNRPPPDYLAKSYYELWAAGLETLLGERGL